jgi:hypothetical protein
VENFSTGIKMSRETAYPVLIDLLTHPLEGFDIAARQGYLEAILLIYDQELLPEVLREWNIPLLAAQAGQDDIVEFFLDHDDFEVDLHHMERSAVQNQHLSTVKLLFEKDTLIRDTELDYLLRLAASTGNVEITVLHTAVRCGSLDLVKLYLQEDPELSTSEATSIAIQNGHAKIAQLLSDNFETPPMLPDVMRDAIRDNRVDMAKFLADHGVPIYPGYIFSATPEMREALQHYPISTPPLPQWRF